MTELKRGGHLRKICSLAGHSPAWWDGMAAGGMRWLSHGICRGEAEGEGCWGSAHSLLSPFNFATTFIYVVVGTNAMDLWKPILSYHVRPDQAW